MSASLQSTWLGDILFTTTANCSVSMTVTGPTTYTWSATFERGTWFASALHLWQYMANQWNLSAAPAAGGQMTVTLVSDPEDTNYRKFLITPDTGYGTITAISFVVEGVYLDMGMTADTWNYGATSGAFYTVNQATHLMTPYWPLREYTRGVDTLSGYADRAQDGTPYSLAGATQETVQVGVSLERTSDYAETDLWLTLWLDRWSRGRAVTLYVDREDLPTAWATTVGRADVLVLTQARKSIDFKRLVEYKEVQDAMESVQFGIKPAWPITSYGQSYFLVT